MKQTGTTTIRENECKNVFRNTDTANRQKAFTTLWINHINEKENSLICINDTDYYIDFDEFKTEIRKVLEANLERKTYVREVKKEETKEIILNNTSLKVALCAIAKNENLYIREWVEWYKNLGISKIFLYDNNELDGERFEEVINDYIKEGFVEIIDRRGIIKTVSTDKDGQTLQGLTFKDCFYNHYKEKSCIKYNIQNQ